MRVHGPHRKRGAIILKRTARFALFVVLLFILSTFALTFHHHAEGTDHPNCPACTAAHFPAAVTGVFALQSPQSIVALRTRIVSVHYASIQVNAFFSRAPPG
jgi:hypothetical protein